MMGLGPMGGGAGGNSSSSTSNLSALAPPFTVDRVNPKPNSNPNLHYSDAPYAAEPYSHGWPYPSPSAPFPELPFDSSGITSLPLSNDYGYSPLTNISPTGGAHWPGIGSGSKSSAASVFAYGGGSDVKPYYSPYDPPLVGEDSMLVADSSVGRTPGKSQSDYSSSLFDADYVGRRVDNLGFDDGKRAKRVAHDGSFFEKANHSYANHLNQGGGFGIEKNKKISMEYSKNVSNQIFNQAPHRELNTGPPLTSVTQMENNSCLEQNLGFYPYDSNKTHTSAYIPNNFSYDQNSFEKSGQPAETPFMCPISAMMLSPAVVIRPPPAINGNYGQRTSAKPTQFENVESTQNVVFGLNSNSQFKEDSFEENIFNISFDRKINSRFGSQLPDVKILGGFNTASDNNNNNNVNSSESCSDFIDHNSTIIVDSPCWKGASSSQFPPFDIESCGTSNNHIKGNTDEKYYVFNGRAFPEKAGERIKNIENETTKERSMPRKESVISGFISEGAVAVHAAEKVLALPTSQEDVTEGNTVLEGRKLDVPTVIKVMHSLSELLMCCVSGDGCCLEGNNTETLQNTIGNLHSCLSNNKITETSKKPEARNQVGDGFDKLRETRDVGSILGSPIATNEPLVSQINCQHMHGDETSYNFSGKKDENSPILPPLGHIDMDINRGDDMTMAIKKLLEENFHVNEEMNSQALLFKNLWLDAEAKLCSISYKARFDRMRIQMEQVKIRASQEDEDIEETKSEVCISPDGVTASELGHDVSISKATPQNVSIPSTSGPVDASVRARFGILKSREDNNAKPVNTEEKQKLKTFDCEQHDGSSIMARFNILKSRDENLKSIRSMEEERQSKRIDGGLSREKYVSRSEDEAFNLGSNNEGKLGSYILGAGYEDLDEFHLSVSKDGIVHSFKSIGGMIDRNRLGRCDSSPSDWDHVLKDDFSWNNM